MAPKEPEDQDDEEEEDFSFPTTTNSPPRFIGSPRLWRSSSNSLYLLETQPTKQEQNEPDVRKKINLLSYIRSKDGGGGNNENMDVIWEDLNYEEEICGFRSDIDGEMPEWGRKMRNMVKVGGGKRLRMVVLVNVLKKLFLLQNASRKLDR
ncbi:hypothetical protein L6452_34462 [Arctium lappa]|uniref:Uncharacterized protein n=1 Tax=Arctium lappa TaxID=4217 RepID=A0ACB8YJU4_ARCLA|nr:hypothetical protein L6452_34462 [Arctium lappa]